MGTFSLLLDDSSLCQVDIKLASTECIPQGKCTAPVTSQGWGQNESSVSEQNKYVEEGRTGERRWAKICMPGSGHKLLLWEIWEVIGRFYFDLLSYSMMWMKHRCREGSGRPDRERCSSSGMKGSWWDPRRSSEVEATLNWWMRLSSEQEWRSCVLLGTHISIVVQVWPWVSWWERVQEEQTERNPQGS